MSKRIATFQISDRNPVDPSDEEDNYSNSSGSEREERASEQEIRQRKISKPRSISNRSGTNKKPVPSLGNLFSGLPTNPFATSSQPSTNTTSTTSDDDYDLKMRGLNTCFVESAQKLLERAPTADFSKLFQQYSKHLASFSINLGAKTEDVKIKESIGTVKPTEPIKTFELPKTAEPFKTFELPKPVEPVKPFELPKPAEPVKPFEFAKPAEPIKTFEFTKSSEPIKTFELPKPAEPVKTLEPVKPFELPKTTEPFKPFEMPKPAETVTENPVAPASIFNFTAKPVEEPKKTEVIDLGDESDEPVAASVPAFKPFSFGSTAIESKPVTEASPFKPFSFGAAADEGKSSTATANPFSFGSTSTDAPAFKPFSFGATESKVDEAPKFSFGSTSVSGLAPLPTFSFGAAPSSTSGFSFTVPTVSASKEDQSGGEGDEIPPEEAESFNLTRTNSEQLKTGAGEENETCQHEERCKIFSSSPNGWVDLGVGIFKINRYNNETGKSRILCRTEGSGKVILNALVSVPGMDVTGIDGKKEVALLAIGPDGKPAKYLIRVKTLEQAESLKSALLSEIEYVKSNKN